jgi:hypothetical protein
MGEGRLLAAGCRVRQLVVLAMAAVLQHLRQLWRLWL